jgi:hypothetical protein
MSSRNRAFPDRTDIIGRSGFRGSYWWATSKRSPDPTTDGKARPAGTGRAFDSTAVSAAGNEEKGKRSHLWHWHRSANASIALQHRCPLETLQHAVLREEDGKASTPLGAALDLIAADRGEAL